MIFARADDFPRIYSGIPHYVRNDGQGDTFAALNILDEMKLYYVYILSNKNGMLYTGVTHDLEGRMQEHKQKRFKGYTQKFGIDRLVYYEEFEEVLEAIEREKQIKKWRRSKKIVLIKEINPKFEDLSADWFE